MRYAPTNTTCTGVSHTPSCQNHFRFNPSRMPVRDISPFRGEPSNSFARTFSPRRELRVLIFSRKKWEHCPHPATDMQPLTRLVAVPTHHAFVDALRLERGETLPAAGMKLLFRFDERPEIIYFSTVGGDFGVDKSDNKALLRRWRERMAYPVQIFLNAGHGLLRSKSFQGAKVAFLTIDS